MARKKIRTATDQRKFTLVYNDFLESDLLNYYEKLVFITLKKFSNNDNMKAFPSLKKIQAITGISLSQVRRSIEHMEELGVIGVEHRKDDEKGNQSNIYTLYDYAEVWNVGTCEDVATAKEEVSEMKLVAELKARGYKVTKEKEPDNTEPTKVTVKPSTKNNHIYNANDTVEKGKSQAELEERYTMQDVRSYFEYDYLIADKPTSRSMIEAIMNVLYNVLNTNKRTIRVNGEDRPAMIVISRLMKLNCYDIQYVIEKYCEQTDKIRNPEAYLLTLLYKAKEQAELDITNQVRHDMANWNDQE